MEGFVVFAQAVIILNIKPFVIHTNVDGRAIAYPPPSFAA
jgi:hypothetical protein